MFSRARESSQARVILLPDKPFRVSLLNVTFHNIINIYRTRAIITRSWFETALNYKPRILDPKIEEFPCLVHKLSVTLTALQYKPNWKMA